MRMGVLEILLIVLLVVVLFGSAKIPGMMRNLASGVKVFKKEMKDATTDDKKVSRNTSKKSVKKSVGKKK